MLITGASGFLGSALVRAFRREGHPVKALVRATSPRTTVDLDERDIFVGDLRDAASLERIFDGIGILVHAAADYRLWARDPSELYQANVDGTRAILSAARAAKVGRIVYTSSVATLVPGTAATPSDEDATQNVQAVVGHYKRSKTMAEHVASDMARDGLPVVIVNPSTPIGPRDIKPTPTGRIIVQAATGGIPAFVDTGLNLAHVDDVAQGHVLAARHGRIGERYILGGHNVPLAEMLAEIARQTGRRAPSVRLPVGAIVPVAAVAEAMARVTGRTPFVSFDALRMARRPMFYTDAKARERLHYRARPWQDGITDALAWFERMGMLR
ncbi:NAD-dependent epimerase/dehydratase family protein [Acuticoccus sp. M5D2P5]|nr:NAD-dependent epimerase/dehydratase family protein [Acuticoccus kalidii]